MRVFVDMKHFQCAQCGTQASRKSGSVNRALKIGAPLYCGKTCAGLARRNKNPPTEEERKAAKAAYDAKRRAEKAEEIKAAKAAYYQRTRDPEREREIRRQNKGRHVEYCRRPEYRAKKAEYDRQKHLAEYGPLADAVPLLEELEREIRSRASSYAVRVAKGYYTRSAQNRRRELWQLKKRN
jgi:hypothetical protein